MKNPGLIADSRERPATIQALANRRGFLLSGVLMAKPKWPKLPRMLVPLFECAQVYLCINREEWMQAYEVLGLEPEMSGRWEAVFDELKMLRRVSCSF